MLIACLLKTNCMSAQNNHSQWIVYTSQHNIPTAALYIKVQIKQVSLIHRHQYSTCAAFLASTHLLDSCLHAHKLLCVYFYVKVLAFLSTKFRGSVVKKLSLSFPNVSTILKLDLFTSLMMFISVLALYIQILLNGSVAQGWGSALLSTFWPSS